MQVILYTLDHQHNGPGYVDFLEDQRGVWIIEAQKTTPRFHHLSPRVIEALSTQRTADAVPTDELLLNSAKGRRGWRVAAPALPPLRTDTTTAGPVTGLTIGLWVRGGSRGGPLLASAGLNVSVAAKTGLLTVSIESAAGASEAAAPPPITLFSDDHCGGGQAWWDAEPRHVAVTLDAAATVASLVIDGRLCDGGSEPPGGGWSYRSSQGWANFPAQFGSLACSGAQWQLGSSARRLRVWGRPLLTSEAIGVWRHGDW